MATSVPAVGAAHGTHALSHPPAKSAVERFGRGFFGSFKRDYVYQACLKTLDEVGRQLPAWIDHYNQEAPHSALDMRAPAAFYAAWLVTNKTRPVHN